MLMNDRLLHSFYNDGIIFRYGAERTEKNMRNVWCQQIPTVQEFTGEIISLVLGPLVPLVLYRMYHYWALLNQEFFFVFRVIGSLSNFDEFGKAYGCKQGMEAMYPNPEDTCRVW